MAHPSIPDAWDRGERYERFIGRWSRRIALDFLDWLRIPDRLRWLDVGCGTGALCSAIAARRAPASLVGVEPSRGFLESAAASLASRAGLAQGTATALPLRTASVDVAVSGLVLNFVPDPPDAVRESMRVTVPGGTLAAYVWDYAERMEVLRRFWDAATALDPRAVPLDEGVRFPLCRPDALRELFTAAGLDSVEVVSLEASTPFESFDDYWEPFLGGQGPAPAYAATLEAAARERLRDRIRTGIPLRDDGSFELGARAWAVRGTVKHPHERA